MSRRVDVALSSLAGAGAGAWPPVGSHKLLVEGGIPRRRARPSNLLLHGGVDEIAPRGRIAEERGGSSGGAAKTFGIDWIEHDAGRDTGGRCCRIGVDD